MINKTIVLLYIYKYRSLQLYVKFRLLFQKFRLNIKFVYKISFHFLIGMDNFWSHYSTSEQDHLKEVNNEDHESNDNHEEEEVNQRKATITAEEIIDDDDDEKMHLMTNFTIHEFLELFQSISDFLEPRSHKDAMLSPKSKLLLTLCWCKHGETFKFLAQNYNIAYTYCHDVILSTITSIVDRLVDNNIKWISVNERISEYNLHFKDWPLLLGSLDATVQEINNPHITNDPYYSGKHKFHCAKVQGFVSPTGLLIHFSRCFPGKIHDFQVFKDSGLKKLILEENNNCQRIFKENCTVLADSGYQGISKEVPGAVTPRKKQRGQERTVEDMAFNKTITYRRIIVENWFGRLKTLWRIMFHCYRLRITFYDTLWKFCAAITNFHIKHHPLRANQDEEEEEEEES